MDPQPLDYASPQIGGRKHRRWLGPLIASACLVALVAIIWPDDNRHNRRRAEQATRTVTHARLQDLSDVIRYFRVQVGRFPTDAEGFTALIKPPAGASPEWKQSLDAIPRDGWGNPCNYRNFSRGGKAGFLLSSNGPDGIQGTSDDVIYDSTTQP